MQIAAAQRLKPATNLTSKKAERFLKTEFAKMIFISSDMKDGGHDLVRMSSGPPEQTQPDGNKGRTHFHDSTERLLLTDLSLEIFLKTIFLEAMLV